MAPPAKGSWGSLEAPPVGSVAQSWPLKRFLAFQQRQIPLLELNEINFRYKRTWRVPANPGYITKDELGVMTRFGCEPPPNTPDMCAFVSVCLSVCHSLQAPVRPRTYVSLSILPAPHRPLTGVKPAHIDLRNINSTLRFFNTGSGVARHGVQCNAPCHAMLDPL